MKVTDFWACKVRSAWFVPASCLLRPEFEPGARGRCALGLKATKLVVPQVSRGSAGAGGAGCAGGLHQGKVARRAEQVGVAHVAVPPPQQEAGGGAAAQVADGPAAAPWVRAGAWFGKAALLFLQRAGIRCHGSAFLDCRAV